MQCHKHPVNQGASHVTLAKNLGQLILVDFARHVHREWPVQEEKVGKTGMVASDALVELDDLRMIWKFSLH